MGEVRKKNEQMNLALGVFRPKWNAFSVYKTQISFQNVW